MLIFVPDYVGIGCEYEFDACKAEICQNGAACEDYENGYKCTCLPGMIIDYRFLKSVKLIEN